MAIQRSSERVFHEEEPEFQVAPMIDVLLVLMTFFMSITSTEVLKTKTKLGELHLPIAKNSKNKESSQNEVVLNVLWNQKDKTGSIELEEKTLNGPEEVTSIILQRKGNQPFFRAVIRADHNVPYSFVQKVLAACAASDVDNITFSVLSKESKRTYSGSQ